MIPAVRRGFCGYVACECTRGRRRPRTVRLGAGGRLRRAETRRRPARKRAGWARRTAGTGARRSASKSSIALTLTEAADASFATDQPSRARAERHWAAEIIALG